MIRVGLGYDIHRLTAGRRLVIGGVDIPHNYGLDGHSDADVLLHAIMDALLGAAGLGDIGRHFPPSDERYRDIASLALLEQVAAMVGDEGWEVVNVDAVVVAEAPRIAPFAAEMRARIAELLSIPVGAVGIKATTNEGTGPEGRCEAISAQAVCLLQRPA